MKTIADFPAFEVIDLEIDVINLPREVLDGMKFCVSKETLRHGNLYPEVSPSCAAYYAMQYNEDPVAAEARCDKFGHEKYWINNVGAMITSSKTAKGVRILLKDGQKISMNGKLLQVKHNYGEYYNLVEVAE